jgi:hypothetical protein
VNADATARYVITADDRTKAALASIKKGFSDLQGRVEGFNRLARIGFGAASIAGVGRFTTQLAEAAQQARDATDSFAQMREALGGFSRYLTDEELTRLAELGDAFDRTADAAKGFGARVLSTAAPALRELAAGLRTLAGGATELEKLNTQLDFLGRMKGTGFLSLGYGDFGTQIVTPGEVREGIARLQAQRDAITRMMDGMRSGAIVGDLPSITVEATSTRPGARSSGQDAARDAARKAAQEARNAARQFQESLNAGTREALDQVLEDFNDRGDAQQEKVRETMQAWRQAAREATDGMSVYADQAARNMQDAFAQFLFDPFKGGVRGMLSSFTDALRQMVAQAAAAKIFESFGGAGGVRGIVSSALSFFGGFRAEGGPVMGGRGYIVGERGPELFVPRQSGGIVPNHQLGGRSVTINQTISGLGLSFEQVQLLMQRNNRELVRQITDPRMR